MSRLYYEKNLFLYYYNYVINVNKALLYILGVNYKKKKYIYNIH